MSLRDEGTFAFWIGHPHTDWMTNANGYMFGPFAFEGFRVGVTKEPSGEVIVVISGPHSRTFRLSGRPPGLQLHPEVLVVITWTKRDVLLYLNGRQVRGISLEPIQVSTLSFTLDADGQTITADTVTTTMGYILEIFNTVSAFVQGYDAELTRIVLATGVDKNKFELVESREGSFIAIMKGIKEVFSFATARLNEVLAILCGKGNRLAEAIVHEREAQAQFAQAKADQEKIATMQKYLELCTQVADELAARSPLPAEETMTTINAKFMEPMNDLGKLLLDNHMTLTFSDPAKHPPSQMS